MIDVNRLGRILVENIEPLCRHFFPQGRKVAQEWKIGNITGERGDSLGIQLSGLKAGQWHDRATSEGGTFPKLLMLNRALSFPAACQLIGDFSGINLEANPTTKLDMAGAAERVPPTPKQESSSMHSFDWRSAVRPLDPDHRQQLALERGFLPQALAWLTERGEIETLPVRGKLCIAFPVAGTGTNGQVIGLHCRWPEKNNDGKYDWFYTPSGIEVGPLVHGCLSSAKHVLFFESPWDGIALIDRLALAEQIDGGKIAIVCTRGAQFGNRLAKLCLPEECATYAFPQNDEAGERHLASIISSIHRELRVVRTPERFKDLNDWTRAGAQKTELMEAIKAAQITKPETPKTKPKKAAAAEEPQEEQIEETLAKQMEAEAQEVAETIDAYYDQHRKEYAVKVKTNEVPTTTYQSHNEAQFKRDLRFRKLSAKLIPQRFWSQIDIVVQYLQEEKFVSYVGALAGKLCGYYHENGIRFLVTSEPKLIVPVKGQWETLRKFLVNLLWGQNEAYGEDQLNALYGWLKVGYCAFRKHRFQPGQALAIAGPVESGKSLLQALITQCLGGRCAKAALFLQGRTDFNGELFEAEHLILEDEAASTTHAARMALAVQMKNITANRMQACHAKHRPIVNLAPWWRLTISLNDRPERLLILPPLDEDIADKIILLRASCHPMPMPTETIEQREAFWDTLVGELPAFLHWLTNDFDIDEEWRSARFGVRAFHHPMLLTELEELSPAIALLDLIDQANIWEVQSSIWEGTAKELRKLLLDHQATRRDAERLLSWTNACGQYLNDLAKIRPLRVKQRRTHSEREYEIYREIGNI